jgi:hypothetical protein
LNGYNFFLHRTAEEDAGDVRPSLRGVLERVQSKSPWPKSNIRNSEKDREREREGSGERGGVERGTERERGGGGERGERRERGDPHIICLILESNSKVVYEEDALIVQAKSLKREVSSHSDTKFVNFGIDSN